MSPAAPVTDDLLEPITAEQPTGVDLRWTSEWDRIKEARRSDDGLDSGKWAKKDQKTSDWPKVMELVTTALRERSKDLQLALWLTESDIKLRGFEGLRDGLRVTRELMVRYWDKGLYPAMEDGPEDRVGPFEWLNNKLVDSITALSITPRADKGREYSFIDLQGARRKDGKISMAMFEDALLESKRPEQEELNRVFLQVCEEFNALEKVIDEKFGDAAPNLSDCRTALREMTRTLSDILEKKRKAEPDNAGTSANPDGGTEQSTLEQTALGGVPEETLSGSSGAVLRVPLTLTSAQAPQSAAGSSWQEAETLVRSGQVEKGLAAMTRLAAGETSGRNRFQRRFLLAEVCLASRRDRLARSILEELAEQIDKFQLDLWESSDLIGAVWTTLHKVYSNSAESSDGERAAKLYERICRLDPWQALSCTEKQAAK